MNPQDIDTDRIFTSPFFVGLAGAVVALKGCPGKSWGERIVNAGCGALLAGFLSVAIAEWMGLRTAETRSAVAFAVGLFGMNLVASINVWLSEAKIGDFIPWLRKG